LSKKWGATENTEKQGMTKLC